MLAEILVERQNFAEVTQQLRNVVSVYEAQRGRYHPSTLNQRNVYAVAMLRQNQGAAAEPHLRELVAHFRDIGDTSTFAVTALHNLGVARKQQGFAAEALTIVDEAIRMQEKNSGVDSPLYLAFRNTRAGILRDMGQLDAAESLYRDVLERRRRIIGDEHFDTARTMHELGDLLLADRPEEAVEMLDHALRVRSAKLGPEHPQTVESERAIRRARAQLSDRSAGHADVSPVS